MNYKQLLIIRLVIFKKSANIFINTTYNEVWIISKKGTFMGQIFFRSFSFHLLVARRHIKSSVLNIKSKNHKTMKSLVNKELVVNRD